jgi:hypothetical protein
VDDRVDDIFHQCQRGSHGGCGGESREMRMDLELVRCQCLCHDFR